MKALVRDGYGSPDVLDVRDIDVPVPKENEVLVRVHAASINDWDVGLLQRPPLPFRVIGSLLRAVSASAPPPVTVLGCDIAGTVSAVGSRVAQFRPGDPVYGDLSRFGLGGWGGFAEYVCAPEHALVLKPARMSFEQAAALPQAGVLAMQGLLANGPLQAGQKILINGAGGGVGTIGVQLAKQQDVEVTGVDRAAKLGMMRSIGFDHVIDFETEQASTVSERAFRGGTISARHRWAVRAARRAGRVSPLCGRKSQRQSYHYDRLTIDRVTRLMWLASRSSVLSSLKKPTVARTMFSARYGGQPSREA